MRTKGVMILVAALGMLAYLIYPRAEPAGSDVESATPAPAEKKLELQLPAPWVAATPAPVEPQREMKATNLFTRLLNGEAPKLSPDQIEAYLAQNHRTAPSLLAAFRASSDLAYLKEAEERFPNDPLVAYAAAFKSDSGEERNQWLDRLKAAAPDNALPSYLSALDAFKAGQPDLAVQELTTAAAKQRFDDYSASFLQGAEEAYRSAGYPEAEVKTIAAMQLLLPDLGELRQLSHRIVDLAGAYRQAGDSASADAALQLDISLGERFGGFPGEPLISRLVGMAIQSDAMGNLDPDAVLGGQTAKDRLAEIEQTRQTLKGFAQQETGLFQRMSEQDVISYWDRFREFGYEPTMRWAIAKFDFH